MPFFSRIFRASIKDERDLSRYTQSVTLICVAIALAVDVANQLTFFVDWTTCLRSWAITTAVVLTLAVPIARTIARAHLELYRAKQHADALSRIDQLTGLANRRALMEAVAAAPPEALALVIVDIDRFKRVNDSYGHLAGDEVIRSVAQAMVEELTDLGLVARVGGEEFALLSLTAPADLVATRLNVLRERVATTTITASGHAVRVTISAGVAMRRGGQSFDELYSAADRALYAAKAAGRNRVLMSDPLDGFGEREPIARSDPATERTTRSA
jgi:diguanylate cyclase (GGDEF)-like protein